MTLKNRHDRANGDGKNADRKEATDENAFFPWYQIASGGGKDQHQTQ